MSDNPIRWSKYMLPNGREVYLTQRPDSASPESVEWFINLKIPIVRFCFCDDYVERPKGDPTCHWYPWVPNNDLRLESVYPFLVLMDQYVKSTEPGSIWLHCDSSSMRAPTFFGIYLATHFPLHLEEICQNMTVFPDTAKYVEYAQYSRADKYLQYSINKDPGVRELIEVWNRKGPNGGYQFYMGYAWALE